MSDSNTEATNNSRSFEERVFLRFDAVDERLGSIENRVGKLESKQYDTKPIWEQALHEIEQTNARVEELGTTLARIDTRVEELGTALARTDARVEQLQSEIKSEFSTFRGEMKDSLHKIEGKIEALNSSFLKIQADHLYHDKRLRDLESQST